MVAMLYKTNIFAIVGSEKNENYKQNQVLIWDDLSGQILYNIELNNNVLNLKLRRDLLFIVCEKKIYVLDIKNGCDMSLTIDTGSNPNGLIAINYNEENAIIAYPSCESDQKKGDLTIKNLNNNEVKYLFPHEHKISYIALSYDGLLLATASEEGKKIRIYETENLVKVKEFYRGKEKAEIKCISLDFRNQFLAASSERGTIHIWKLKNKEDDENKISNTGSMFSGLPRFLGGGLFQNEWSFAQVRLEEPYSIFHFGSENSLIIITTSGKYYKANIDLQKGGDCIISEECSL